MLNTALAKQTIVYKLKRTRKKASFLPLQKTGNSHQTFVRTDGIKSDDITENIEVLNTKVPVNTLYNVSLNFLKKHVMTHISYVANFGKRSISYARRKTKTRKYECVSQFQLYMTMTYMFDCFECLPKTPRRRYPENK